MKAVRVRSKRDILPQLGVESGGKEINDRGNIVQPTHSSEHTGVQFPIGLLIQNSRGQIGLGTEMALQM